MILKTLIAIAILALAISVAIIYIHHIVDKKISDYQMDVLEKHYEEVDNMYKQTRGWRHDYHNHIQTMKAHLEMGNLKELEEYLNKLDEDLTGVDHVIKSGNTKIDAALNSKISLARKKGIQVNAKAVVPKDINISEIDLSIIIGNLMDNAMEACLKIEDEKKRFIRIYLDVLKGNLYIYVMNSVGDELKKIGNKYLSTKKGSHGFGLMRLDNIVKKYQGYLDRQDESDVFVTEIMLPLEYVTVQNQADFHKNI